MARICWILTCSLVIASMTQAAPVNLALQPPVTVTSVGNTVGIQIVATNAGPPEPESVSVIDVIVHWNPAVLQLTGFSNAGAPPWFISGFLNDADGINAPIGPGLANDGDALFSALATPGGGVNIPSTGQLVTTLNFLVLAPTAGTPIDIVLMQGMFGQTRVIAQGQPNVNILGTVSGAVVTTMAPPVCGNGMVEAGEQCDDGANGNLCDGCNDACQTIPIPTCDDDNTCTTDGCVPATGMCGFTPVANGTACDDGNACSQTDSCQMGTCTGSNPVVCTASDQCHVAGVCDPGTGVCSNPAAPDGTACSDGNACTQTDSCQMGTCTGSNPVVCTPSDQCHVAGVCDPGTGMCSDPLAPNGTACDDGNACTQTDSCLVGLCVGANPVVCTASDQCHVAGVCDPGTGVCSNPAAPNGTPCTDGNACTQTDSCQMGMCTGSNPVVCTASDQCHVAGVCDRGSGLCSNPAAPDGTACTDGNACTQTDTCQAGSCTGANPVICTASDQCHVAGVCHPGTGMCSNPAAPDGTVCTDGNACTQTDSCQAGMCTGMNPVVCTPSDQCHAVGMCDPGTGACSDPALPDGTACSDSNACTQTDSCQAGTCTGSNPVVCTPSDQCHVAGVCDPGSGLCSNPAAADGTACSDDDACTVGDQCTSGACASGGPLVCDDMNPCTDDSCDPGSGCVFDIDDTNDCSDGAFCNGLEICDGGACLPGSPPCTVNQFCDEAADVCLASVAMLDIELASVHVPVMRCLRLTPLPGPCTSFFDVPVAFADHDGDDADEDGYADGMPGQLATPVRGSASVNLGPNRASVCIKDEQHTLTSSVGLMVVGDHYEAALLSLDGGDDNDDDMIDMTDVAFLMAEFGTLADPGSCPWDGTPDADFANNGAVGSDDFSILSANWMQTGQCLCTLAADGRGQGSGVRGQGSERPGVGGQGSGVHSEPRTPSEGPDPRPRISTRQLPPHVAARADLNRDDFVDVNDVEEFERQHGLTPLLSTKLRTPNAK